MAYQNSNNYSKYNNSKYNNYGASSSSPRPIQSGESASNKYKSEAISKKITNSPSVQQFVHSYKPFYKGTEISIDRNKFATNQAYMIAQECALAIQEICCNLLTNESYVLVSNLVNQIMKSSTSVCANISENNILAGTKTFAHKINISLGEANETICWLQHLYRSNYIDEETYNNIYDGYIYIIRMLTKSLNTLKQKKDDYFE